MITVVNDVLPFACTVLTGCPCSERGDQLRLNSADRKSVHVYTCLPSIFRLCPAISILWLRLTHCSTLIILISGYFSLHYPQNKHSFRAFSLEMNRGFTTSTDVKTITIIRAKSFVRLIMVLSSLSLPVSDSEFLQIRSLSIRLKFMVDSFRIFRIRASISPR